MAVRLPDRLPLLFLAYINEAGSCQFNNFLKQSTEKEVSPYQKEILNAIN